MTVRVPAKTYRSGVGQFSLPFLAVICSIWGVGRLGDGMPVAAAVNFLLSAVITVTWLVRFKVVIDSDTGVIEVHNALRVHRVRGEEVEAVRVGSHMVSLALSNRNAPIYLLGCTASPDQPGPGTKVLRMTRHLKTLLPDDVPISFDKDVLERDYYRTPPR